MTWAHCFAVIPVCYMMSCSHGIWCSTTMVWRHLVWALGFRRALLVCWIAGPGGCVSCMCYDFFFRGCAEGVIMGRMSDATIRLWMLIYIYIYILCCNISWLHLITPYMPWSGNPFAMNHALKKLVWFWMCDIRIGNLDEGVNDQLIVKSFDYGWILRWSWFTCKHFDHMGSSIDGCTS